MIYYDKLEWSKHTEYLRLVSDCYVNDKPFYPQNKIGEILHNGIFIDIGEEYQIFKIY